MISHSDRIGRLIDFAHRWGMWDEDDFAPDTLQLLARWVEFIVGESDEKP